MACVKQRRSKWVADWRDDAGRRYWRTFDTQEDANIFLGKVTEKLKRGTFQRPADVPTFAQVAADWLADKAPRVRIATYAQYIRSTSSCISTPPSASCASTSRG